LEPITGESSHNDATQITLNFDMLPGYNSVAFNVVFASDEDGIFPGSTPDGFGLFVNGVNIAQVSGLLGLIGISRRKIAA